MTRSFKLYAVSGSLRARSTNMALLRALQDNAPAGVEIAICDLIGTLPIFNPDDEGAATSASVLEFAGQIAASDGLIVSTPEYAHALPGGLKNALDWLVSRSEIPGKPMMIVHASHRGDMALEALHEVLNTISGAVCAEAFLRVPLLGRTEEEVAVRLAAPDLRADLSKAVGRFVSAIALTSDET
ncbi:NADPH-dependent FMN reductase [Rhizobium halophytocola]|uniref:NAD(P)H-dependent FMN reductase n=1 Tax=Rhizobium halophytocola TaxID=735519 RepID=A0ABS4DTH7_9HYPH|nr:NADPH-dependent FMN reductase [Rhizobium halophytocola]MBP1849000.1 NAD(P)H-dependent FMN reductase [Rhizobium halophytocola]